jgi:hypothetical protein
MYLFKAVVLTLGFLSFLFGVWLVKSPKKAIEFQIEFYRHINWRIEPLDWKREIRSTLVMGWTAVVCGLGMIVLIHR